LLQKHYWVVSALDRLQAMSLLKELVSRDLVNPDYVSMHKINDNDFQIQIKCDYNKTQIEEYAKNLSLTITEDKERKYLVIFRP
jgi:hypothetical protein